VPVLYFNGFRETTSDVELSDMWANIEPVLYFNEFRVATSDAELFRRAVQWLPTDSINYGEHQVEVVCHEEKFWIGPGTAVSGDLSRFGEIGTCNHFGCLGALVPVLQIALGHRVSLLNTFNLNYISSSISSGISEIPYIFRYSNNDTTGNAFPFIYNSQAADCPSLLVNTRQQYLIYQ
jgi:hypothetical protein